MNSSRYTSPMIGVVSSLKNYSLVSLLALVGLIFAASERTAVAQSITFVQGSFATPQTARSSVAVSYAGAQTAGNLNVVVVGWNDTSAQVQSVSDSRGNVYQRAIGPT